MSARQASSIFLPHSQRSPSEQRQVRFALVIFVLNCLGLGLCAHFNRLPSSELQFMDSISKASSKHVVVVPFPAQGHLPPAIYLARRLAVQGFAVTIINIDSIHEGVQKNWKHIAEQDILLKSIDMELKYPGGYDSKSHDDVGPLFDAIAGLQEPLSDLLALLSTERGPVTCVISDFYHSAAPYAASKLGIPSACLWTGPALWASIEYSTPLVHSHGHIPVNESNAEEVISCLPGLEPMKAVDLPDYLHEHYYYLLGDERTLHRFQRWAMDAWVLINSVYELEARVFDAMQQAVAPSRFVSIGPLFPLKGHNNSSETEGNLRPEDRVALDWLDRQAPNSVLYVAFGSIAVLTHTEFEELAKGLEDSGHSFLWVVRKNQASEGFLDDFLRRTCERGLVLSWVPQVAVLQHDSVAGFLTHCGWNSILESVSAGVPMLGWPCLGEQNTNTKLFVEGKGLGITLQKTSHDLRKAITTLFESEAGQKMKMSAVEAQQVARAAQGGSSYNNLQAFFAALS